MGDLFFFTQVLICGAMKGKSLTIFNLPFEFVAFQPKLPCIIGYCTISSATVVAGFNICGTAILSDYFSVIYTSYHRKFTDKVRKTSVVHRPAM